MVEQELLLDRAKRALLAVLADAARDARLIKS